MKSFSRNFSLLMLIVAVCSVFILNGCSKDDKIVTPTGGVTDIVVNGSLAPTSNSTAEGNLFVTDQDGNPLTISSGDVSAVMNWTTDISSQGSVTITSTVAQDIAAAITMDYSGSMSQQDLDCMETGVTAYINAMGLNDIAEIIKFSTLVTVVQAFTSNKTDLLNAVGSNDPSAGSTALYESIYKATQDVALQNPSFLRTVIAFTDGQENASTVSRSTMITEALNSGIPVFTVTLLNSGGAGADDMKNIADTTGGFAFTIDPDSCSNITNIYAQINNQFNNAYKMSISWPANEMPPSGTSVTVTITVTTQGITKSFDKTYLIP
jgi:hypothetical protein